MHNDNNFLEHLYIDFDCHAFLLPIDQWSIKAMWHDFLHIKYLNMLNAYKKYLVISHIYLNMYFYEKKIKLFHNKFV